MKNDLVKSKDYKLFIQEIKSRVKHAQVKAAVSVNTELMHLYWDMGKDIIEKQKLTTWGDGFLDQLSKDLQKEFPDMKGFSLRNLKYIRQWVQFWEVSTIGQQAVAQIPWGHNLLIMTKLKNEQEAMFYVQKTIENNWSRSVLSHQIENSLHLRQGKSVTNFKAVLPKPQSDLAIQTMKDPYNFDFLTLRGDYDEKELEDALIDHVSKFLLELGAGFSFIGKQYKLNVEGDEFFIDLLFYHTHLHAYVVVELKTQKFKPEFSGQLNFYVSAIDNQIKSKHDNPTIGMLICKSKNKTVVDYSLQGIQKPIGVSEYTLTKSLPEEFKSSLPSIEEIEAELD